MYNLPEQVSYRLFVVVSKLMRWIYVDVSDHCTRWGGGGLREGQIILRLQLRGCINILHIWNRLLHGNYN